MLQCSSSVHSLSGSGMQHPAARSCALPHHTPVERANRSIHDPLLERGNRSIHDPLVADTASERSREMCFVCGNPTPRKGRIALCRLCESKAPTLAYPSKAAGWPAESAQLCGHVSRARYAKGDGPTAAAGEQVFVILEGLPWLLGSFVNGSRLDEVLRVIKELPSQTNWAPQTPEHCLALNVTNPASPPHRLCLATKDRLDCWEATRHLADPDAAHVLVCWCCRPRSRSVVSARISFLRTHEGNPSQQSTSGRCSAPSSAPASRPHPTPGNPNSRRARTNTCLLASRRTCVTS